MRGGVTSEAQPPLPLNKHLSQLHIVLFYCPDAAVYGSRGSGPLLSDRCALQVTLLQQTACKYRPRV